VRERENRCVLLPSGAGTVLVAKRQHSFTTSRAEQRSKNYKLDHEINFDPLKYCLIIHWPDHWEQWALGSDDLARPKLASSHSI